jgi:hypothetical protein
MTPELKKIFSCFENIPYPGDENISHDNGLEAGYVVSYFKKRNWMSLNVQAMRTEYPGDASACLTFMTDDAFRYFFPGYMKVAFVEYNSADAIFDKVIFRLSDAAENLEMRVIFEKYDEAQLRAIAQYCVLLSEKYCRFYTDDLAAIAVSKYWHQYL